MGWFNHQPERRDTLLFRGHTVDPSNWMANLERCFPGEQQMVANWQPFMVNLSLDINLVVLSKLFIGKPTLIGDDPMWTNNFSTGLKRPSREFVLSSNITWRPSGENKKSQDLCEWCASTYEGCLGCESRNRGWTCEKCETGDVFVFFVGSFQGLHDIHGICYNFVTTSKDVS